MKHLILFAHGKESGPWGSKIKHLAAIAESQGCKVLSPDYSDQEDPDARVERLLTMKLLPHDRLVLVGSSMGGYVSTLASRTLQPAGLFLMAPAFYLPGYKDQSPTTGATNTTIVFGWNDELIPPENVFRFAQAQKTDLHLLNSGHRLTDALDEVGLIFERFLRKVLSAHRSSGLTP